MINYLTLDTGDVTPSSADEFSDSDISNMTSWLLNALETPETVSLPHPLSKYKALVNKGDEGLLCTIYAPREIIPAEILRQAEEPIPHDGVPLLILGVALKDGKRLWEIFIQAFYVGDKHVEMPAEPWITVIPYEMYPYIPDHDLIIHFEKWVARTWFEMNIKRH